jgi:hypothetical protein
MVPILITKHQRIMEQEDHFDIIVICYKKLVYSGDGTYFAELS